MDRNMVKQHIINVLNSLLNLADRFSFEDISKEITSCIQHIDPLIHKDKIILEEIVKYHLAEEEE
jgi:hypothetical protein